MATEDLFRILSLDGGGCWALIQAKALLDIYGDIPGNRLLANFDLVAANSGGSIVAAALAANLTSSDIVARFMDERWRRKIFVDLPWFQKIPRILGLGPRFSTSAKLQGLREALGPIADIKLQDLPGAIAGNAQRSPHFLIVGFDYDRERAVFFRSNTGSRAASFSPHASPTLAEAVHASSTAPINFFDEPAKFQSSSVRYWDGAVTGNNNPILAAVVEALANQVPPEAVRALSIGTGSVFLPLKRGVPPLVAPPKEQNLLNDIKEIAGSILDDPPDADTFISHVTLGGALPAGPDQVVSDGPAVRLNPLVQPILDEGEWRLPGWNKPGTHLDSREFMRLVELDIAAIEQADMDLINKFCEEWLNDVVPNQGIRSNGETFAVEVGHSRYGAGKETWLRSI